MTKLKVFPSQKRLKTLVSKSLKISKTWLWLLEIKNQKKKQIVTINNIMVISLGTLVKTISCLTKGWTKILENLGKKNYTGRIMIEKLEQRIKQFRKGITLSKPSLRNQKAGWWLWFQVFYSRICQNCFQY